MSALEHLHKCNIIYRDLKPENVLLDHHGNIRLTDFGLSKENVPETDRGAHSFCGTPEYLGRAVQLLHSIAPDIFAIAPEILDRRGHGRAVDWWSLGALLYEMVTGLPPFYCRDRQKLFEQIRHGRLEFPNYLSAECCSLLAGLLHRNPTQRLGCGPGDADEIKSHPFFRSIDWTALVECRIEPPWKPPLEVKCLHCISCHAVH